MLRKTDENFLMISKPMFRRYEMLTNNSRLSNIDNSSVELFITTLYSWYGKIDSLIVFNQKLYCNISWYTGHDSVVRFFLYFNVILMVM